MDHTKIYGRKIAVVMYIPKYERRKKKKTKNRSRNTSIPGSAYSVWISLVPKITKGNCAEPL